MRAAFAPIQAWAAEQAFRPLAGRGHGAEPVQENLPGIGDGAAIAIKFDAALANQRIGNTNPESSGEVVVAGPSQPESLVTRPSADRGPHWAVARPAGKLRYGLQQVCDVSGRKPMEAVPPMLFHEDQARIQQPCKVPARGLRGDASLAREFACSQRSAIHQGVQHACPSRVPDQGANLGESIGAEHGARSKQRAACSGCTTGCYGPLRSIAIAGAPMSPQPEPAPERQTMDYLPSLATIAGLVLLGCISPGPNFMVVTSTAMSVSRGAGVFAALGVALASLTWASLAVVGLALVLQQAAWLFTALRLAGAGYFVYLGIKIIVGARKPMPLPGRDAALAYAASSVRSGFLTSMTNPKAAAFFGSLFAVTLPVGAPAWVYGATLAIVTALSIAWHCGLALFFSLSRVQAAYRRFKAAISAVMGGVLVLLGVRLLVTR